MALALAGLAAVAGIADALWGGAVAPPSWGPQVATGEWGLPVLALAGGLVSLRYRRSGTVIMALAALGWLVLMALVRGLAPWLGLALLADAAAVATALCGVVAAGDALLNPRLQAGQTVRPDALTRFAAAKLASIPMFVVVLVIFIGCSIWTITYSFTDSTSLPIAHFVGFRQFDRLVHTLRWNLSVKNLAVFGVCSLAISFVVGFLLAVFMDQKIRLEGVFRTIFLYPFALSFIVTGHVWAWIMSPAFGLQKALRDLGWTSFTFDWLTNRDMVVYTLVIAGLWQGSGITMALMLAGLRGIDDEVWKAARVDGIPAWRTYLSIVIPMMRPVLITTLVLSGAGVVKIYDLVVSLTQGGPGLFSEMPSTYVMANLFGGNLAQGLAASSMMLVITAIILVPWIVVEFGRGGSRARAG